MCKGKVQDVKNVTVKHFVNDKFADKIEEENYYICLNEDCNVTYFNNKNQVFNTEDLDTPIWFKKDANPKYICYCNNVTEQQIIDAIVNENAKNMKDIIRITGAIKNGECELKNPLSKCCGKEIEKIIKKMKLI